MPAKKNLEYYNQFAQAKGGRCLSTEYINSQTKYEWECKEGHKWVAMASNIQFGSWCPYCAGSDTKNIEYYAKFAREKGGRCLSTKYINNSTKYEWECQEGHRWTAKANDISNGNWCLKCSGSEKKNIEYYDKFARAKGGKCLSTEYVNAKTKYEWECKGSHKWEAVACSVLSGKWCPKCQHLQSKPEKLIFDLVQVKFPDTQERVHGLLPNKNFELDIYVPSLKKAIEFDGDHWHKSDWALKHGVAERDARKDQQCKEAGIDLLRILESDYKNNPDAEMSKIWRFLGISLKSEP